MSETATRQHALHPSKITTEPRPVNIYLVAYSPEEKLTQKNLNQYETMRANLEKFWGLPVAILTTADEVVGLSIPSLHIHDLATEEVDPYTPYYVMEFSDGTRTLNMVMVSEESEDPPPNPMYS